MGMDGLVHPMMASARAVLGPSNLFDGESCSVAVEGGGGDD